ncbi:MAG TPA: hypothetical protein VIW70_10925 [Rubrivivax sp.]
MTLTTTLRCGLAAGLLLPLCAAAQPACSEAPTVHDATPAQVRSHFKAQKKTVLTFMGYSGAGYEDPAAMLEAAKKVLARHKPSRTVVNIGATAEGIGAVYELAVQRGFATSGIVSTQARDKAVALSPCVQQVFFVADSSWGGLMPGGKGLSPTSAAMVNSSDTVVAIGGGEVTRDEFLAARRAGKKTRFIAADMAHEAATQKAQKNGQPAPSDFRGALAAAL